jgi:hypothetical protein
MYNTSQESRTLKRPPRLLPEVEPGSILLDVSTLRSAAAAANEDRRLHTSTELRDFDLVGLAHLVEAIVLGPELLFLQSAETLPAVTELGLTHVPFIRFLHIDEALVGELETAPRHLEVHRYIWEARQETQASLLQLIGLVFRVTTGSGYDFINSCKKSTYKYLTGVAPDNSLLLAALHTWHKRSEWYDNEVKRVEERLERFAQKVAWNFKYVHNWKPTDRSGYHRDLPDELLEQIGLESETERLLMALYWLTDRAVFYYLLGMLIGAVYFPSSLRSNLFALTGMVMANPAEKSHIGFLVQQINESLNASLHSLLQQPSRGPFVSLVHPPFFQYVCSKASSTEEIIPLALELRETKGACVLRSKFCDLERARSAGDNRELHAISRTFHQVAADVSAWLTSEDVNLHPTKVLRLFGVTVGLFDDYLIRLKVPALLRKPFFPGQPHFALVRDLTADLLEIYALGASYERLFR